MGAVLSISILTDAKNARKGIDDTIGALGDLDKATSHTTDTLAGIGKAAVAVTAVGAVALGAFAVSAWSAAEESAKVGRETERVIKTTGGAANVTAQQVNDLAGSISDLTGADDEMIQSAANLLLTFTNVRNQVGEGNDIFSQATALSLDMATALGTDASGAAIQLGKALNDPIKGITALSRAGVSFTEDQKKQIQTLVETGDLLGAQKIILGELAKEFGGAAAAAATPLDRLKVMLGNAQEAIGAFLIPVAEVTATWLADRLPAAMDLVTAKGQELSDWFANNVAPALQTVADITANALSPRLQELGQWLRDHNATVPIVAGLIIGLLVPAFVAWGISATAAAASTLAATWPVLAIIGALSTLAAGLIWAWQNSTLFRDVVTTLATELLAFYSNVLVPAGTFLAGVFTEVWRELQIVWTDIQTSVLPPLMAGFQYFWQNILQPLLQFVRQNSDAFKVLAIVVGIAAGLMIAIGAAVAGTAVLALGLLVAGTTAVTAGFVLLISVVWRVIQTVWDFFNACRDSIGGAAAYVGDRIAAIVGFFAGLRDRLGFTGLFDGLTFAFRAAIAAVAGIWNRLRFTMPAIDFAGQHIGGFDVGVPPIHLAAGGIVTAPTIALLGENGPEAVLPLTGRYGNTYNITVQTTGLGPDSPQIARDVVAAIRAYERRNGPVTVTP